MAALRSLEDEDAMAVWRREYTRRIRDNNVCNLCGYTRRACICHDEPENYAPSRGEGAHD